MRRASQKMEMAFTVERGSNSVDYVCEFTISPYDPGRTYGPPEKCYPPEGGEVEDKAVYFERIEPCPDHRFTFRGRDACRSCKKVREPRPEMDDLVDDAELLEHAGDYADDGPDYDDRDDDAFDRANDR